MAQEKEFVYATLIGAQIQAMFQDDCENHVNPEDLTDSESFKKFIHALATIVPAMLFNKLTGEEHDNLSFNHIANRLVFEYSEKEQ